MKLGKFMLGLGIGVVAGMLLAPKKGSELREDIKNESLKAYETMKNITKEDIEVAIGTTIENVKRTIDEFDVDEFTDITKEKLNELKDKLEDFSEKVKESEEYARVKEGVVVVTDKVNTKIAEVKNKVLDSTLEKEDIEDLSKEIDAVEEKLDELIEEIKE